VARDPAAGCSSRTHPRLRSRSRLAEHLDPATSGWTRGQPDGVGELRAYLMLDDGAGPDPLSLLLAVDALPPASFDLGLGGWVPTLQLSAWVRAVPAAGPLVVRQRARLVQGQRFDETCDVWDSRGHLVATGHQLAGVRLPRGCASRGGAPPAGVVNVIGNTLAQARLDASGSTRGQC